LGTAEQRFRGACSELGWGDARGGLWFVGIEESSEWKAEEEDYIDRFYNHDAYFRDPAVEAATGLTNVEPPKTRTQIHVVQAKIAAPLSRTRDGHALQEILWRTGSGVAHANLYPLGKPNAGGTLPPQYQRLFGYGATVEEALRYVADVKRLRFPRLREARQLLKPQAIVCMGQGHWPEFREAFELCESNVDRSDTKLQVFTGERIILAPHWAYNNVPEPLAAKISGQLAVWGVCLP
jgi:hypothetical protein